MRNAGSDEQPIWEVMRGFSDFDIGVGDAFLVRVGAIPLDQPLTLEIELLADPANTINASVDRLVARDIETGQAVTGFDRSFLDLGEGASGTGIVIPVGDFDGDGFDDHILSVREESTSSFLYLYYGGPGGIVDPNAALVSAQDVTSIEVPGELLRTLDEPANTTFSKVGQPGDFDGDGIDDLVITSENGTTISTIIVFGGSDRIEQLDAVGTTTLNRIAVVSSSVTGGGQSLDATGVSDLGGDGFDEIVQVDGTTTEIFEGRSRFDWQNPAGGTLVADATYSALARRVTEVGDVDGDGEIDLARDQRQSIALVVRGRHSQWVCSSDHCESFCWRFCRC